MLKVPTALDTPPSLISARRTMDEFSKVTQPSATRSRRKMSGNVKDFEWEEAPKPSFVGDTGKKQTRLLWIGGVGLLALSGAGVFFSVKDKIKPTASSQGQVIAQPAAVGNPVEAIIPPAALRSEAALLAEAELLARKFLEATTVEEMLPLVRNPEVAEARMRGFYPGGKFEVSGMQSLGSAAGLSVRGKLVSLTVRTRDFEEKALAFLETSQGLKIDWESWVGWSEISWQEFMAAKPTSGHVFRVILAPVDYYNFEFTDDQKWQSYRLDSPDREYSVYGYAEKGTVMNEKIHFDGDTKNIIVMLSLKFPVGATSNNQVEIERFVTEGWVEEVSQ